MTRDGSSCVAFFCSNGANLASRQNVLKNGALGIPQAHWTRSSQSYRIEHALDVQIHNLRKSGVRVRIKLLAPRCPSVCEKYINMICCFLDFFDQCLNAQYL